MPALPERPCHHRLRWGNRNERIFLLNSLVDGPWMERNVKGRVITRILARAPYPCVMVVDQLMIGTAAAGRAPETLQSSLPQTLLHSQKWHRRGDFRQFFTAAILLQLVSMRPLMQTFELSKSMDRFEALSPSRCLTCLVDGSTIQFSPAERIQPGDSP